METSLSIHPENFKADGRETFQSIGVVKELVQKGQDYLFNCENGCVNLRFYSQDIVRITMNPKGLPVVENSHAVIKEPEIVDIEVEESENNISLSTDMLLVEIQKSPLRTKIVDRKSNEVLSEDGSKGMGYSSKGEVICYKVMQKEDHFYGFGEKTGFLNKRGERITMWNTDVYAPHNPETDPLYQSIPYFMTLRNGQAHGIFFDNSFKTIFDMKTEKEHYYFWAEDGQLDYYVLGGTTPKDVLEQYTDLTGHSPIPAKWVLGYHQSRYSYKNEQEVRELVHNFRKKNIPLDAVFLDIHYMDEYKVFTIDQNRFPDFEGLIKELNSEGIKVVPIIDPGVKIDPGYDVYREGLENDVFCKYSDGDLYQGDVWPGTCAFPDFSQSKVREWWGKNHKQFADLGISGIWNDMNEPSVFNDVKTMDSEVVHQNDGNPKTHRELHNMYGFLMVKATYEGLQDNLNEQRPFVLTRAGYAGIQRYGTVWTGDNRSFWEHLQMVIPMCLNLGISGIPMCGADVGGFAHDASGELLARWTQLAAFTPYFRNHSEISSIHQEPWVFGSEIEDIVKKYIHLRYKWLPHLYTLFAETYRTGMPVMRPLMMEYPDDPNTYNLSDEFLVGENVVVAPILHPHTFHRVVYLPGGKWFDYWTDEMVEGGQHFLAEASLNDIPIFIKEGSIILEGSAKDSTNVEEPEVTIHVYPKEGQWSYTLYDDDGETLRYEKEESYVEKIICSSDKNQLSVDFQTLNERYIPKWQSKTLKIHHVGSEKSIFINGEKMNEDRMSYDACKKVLSIDLKIG